MLQAFYQFEQIHVLKQITLVLHKIIECDPDDIFGYLEEAFETQYSEFLQAETNEIIESNGTESHANPAIKMSILMHNFSCEFLDYFQFEALTVINLKHLQNPRGPSFPIFARLHTIVLRILWNNIRKESVDDEPLMLPYDLNFVVRSVNDLAGKLMTQLRRDFDLIEAFFVFTTLMELLSYYYIPPTLVDDKQRLYFVNQPKVTSQQMNEISKFAEFYVFKVIGTVEETSFNVNFQKNMLLTLTELIKNNNKLPNVSAVSKVVQYYAEPQFKDELKTLLNVLIFREVTFVETIALAIFQFAISRASLDKFLDFSLSLEDFLQEKYDDKFQEIRYIKLKISMFVLNQLTNFVNRLSKSQEDDRLMVLDFLMEFIDEFDPVLLNTL